MPTWERLVLLLEGAWESRAAMALLISLMRVVSKLLWVSLQRSIRSHLQLDEVGVLPKERGIGVAFQ